MTDRRAEFSEDDYDKLVYYRKAGIRTKGTPEERPFELLTRRYFADHPLTPERLAWHEAGHAVVSHRLGYRVVAIEWIGPLHWATLPHRPMPFSKHFHLMMVAGYLAEARAMGRVDPAEASHVAFELEERYGYGPEERRAYVEAVEERALAILVEHWPAVVQVSVLLRQLNQDRTLVAGDELDAALAGVRFGDD